ncbi:6960_t:CDS:1, partial [Racocetra fulgida]
MQYPPVDQFQNRAALIKHVRSFGASHGYGISITRSKPNKVYLGCDRSRSYRNCLDLTDETRKRQTGSRLIGCPFSLHGTKEKNNIWTLSIQDSTHNHVLSKNTSSHPSLRRLDEPAQNQLNEMTKAGV